MKIDSSTLSMDASTGHTEVRKTEVGMISQEVRPQDEKEIFTLNLRAPIFINESVHKSKQVNEFEAHSQVRSDDGQSAQCKQETREVLTGVVEHVIDRNVRLDIQLGSSQFAEIQKGAMGRWREPGRSFRVGGNPFQMAFAAHSLHYEHQFVNIQSQGSLSTEDGRNINFSLDIKMERDSLSYESIGMRASAGLLIDPLVLHFDTDLETLSDTFFSFDIDGDGEQETISGLSSGSGFLALDVNEDREITDGNELFGPLSGNGFMELQTYDSDKNRWLDENDPIFERLMIWMGAGGDDERLMTLKEAGVGAISLANVDSSFNLKGDGNRLLGQVAASGIFLTEDGEVRSLQEVDFALPESSELKQEDGERISNIHQAVLLLRVMIARHRERVQAMAARRLVGVDEHRRKDFLQAKFWQWQEEIKKSSF